MNDYLHSILSQSGQEIDEDSETLCFYDEKKNKHGVIFDKCILKRFFYLNYYGLKCNKIAFCKDFLTTLISHYVFYEKYNDEERAVKEIIKTSVYILAKKQKMEFLFDDYGLTYSFKKRYDLNDALWIVLCESPYVAIRNNIFNGLKAIAREDVSIDIRSEMKYSLIKFFNELKQYKKYKNDVSKMKSIIYAVEKQTYKLKYDDDYKINIINKLGEVLINCNYKYVKNGISK